MTQRIIFFMEFFKIILYSIWLVILRLKDIPAKAFDQTSPVCSEPSVPTGCRFSLQLKSPG